jgi:hypothetical protein
LVFPVAEQQKAQNNEQAVASDPKLIVSALFASSGAVAPVDFARFGQRVGEIIACGRSPARTERHLRPLVRQQFRRRAGQKQRETLTAKPIIDCRPGSSMPADRTRYGAS